MAKKNRKKDEANPIKAGRFRVQRKWFDRMNTGVVDELGAETIDAGIREMRRAAAKANSWDDVVRGLNKGITESERRIRAKKLDTPHRRKSARRLERLDLVKEHPTTANAAKHKEIVKRKKQKARNYAATYALEAVLFDKGDK